MKAEPVNWDSISPQVALSMVAEESQSGAGGARVGVPSTKAFLLPQGSCCVYLVYCSLLLFGSSTSLGGSCEEGKSPADSTVGRW